MAAVIVDSPQTQNVTAVESFMLTCNATGYPVPNIEWRQNSTSYMIRDPSVITITPTDGLRSNSSVITVTNATSSDTGLYQCVATNEVDTDTENATVIVQGEYQSFKVVCCVAVSQVSSCKIFNLFMPKHHFPRKFLH